MLLLAESHIPLPLYVLGESVCPSIFRSSLKIKPTIAPCAPGLHLRSRTWGMFLPRRSALREKPEMHQAGGGGDSPSARQPGEGVSPQEGGLLGTAPRAAWLLSGVRGPRPQGSKRRLTLPLHGAPSCGTPVGFPARPMAAVSAEGPLKAGESWPESKFCPSFLAVTHTFPSWAEEMGSQSLRPTFRLPGFPSQCTTCTPAPRSFCC